MSMITETLPNTIEVGGRVFLVNSDFKTMLRIQELLSQSEYNDDRIKNAIFWFYGSEDKTLLENAEEAAEKFIWFYFCGKPPKEKPKKKEDENEEGADQDANTSVLPCYSYEHDAPLIYAAFMQQYGIDLADADNLHWWKFRALFESLNESTLFYEVRKCRAVKISSKMSSTQQDYYREMKKRYALPLPQKEQEYQDALTEALMNGGDVEAVISKFNKEGGGD